MARARALGGFDLELGPDGTALMVWSHGGNSSYLTETHLDDAGTWAPPHRLDGPSVGDVDATIDGHGLMTVVWTAFNDDGSILRTTSRTPDGAWTPTEQLGAHGGTPTVVTNEDGDTAAAWGVFGGVQVAVRKAGQAWGPVHEIRSEISPDRVDLGVGPDGRVLALWPRSEDDERYTKRHLAWAQTLPDGTWTDVAYLDTRLTRGFGTWLEFSMTTHGRAFAFWHATGRKTTGYKTAYFDFATGWTTPTRLVSLRYCCVMNAWLADSGTAVVLYGPAGRSDTATWAYQRPGHRWRTAELRPPTLPIATDGAGRRMVLLHFAPNLQARTLVIRSPSS